MAFKHAVRKWRDLLRFHWAKSKFDFKPEGDPDALDFMSFSHIVVLKLDGKVGDTQVMTHFYAALRHRIPGLFLTAVCPSALESVYRDVLGFDLVVTCSSKPRFKEIIRVCKVISDMSSELPVDMAVTTEPNFRPRDFFFNYLLKPRYVAGCERRAENVNLLIFDPYKRTARISECFAALLKKGGIDPGPVVYTPLVTKQSARRIAEQIKSAYYLNGGSERVLIALNPLASSSSRTLSRDTVCILLRKLAERYTSQHAEFFMLLPPNAVDLTAYLRDFASEHAIKIYFLPEHSTVCDLGSGIKAADCLITVETAAIHMACASHTPQLCIYTGDSLKDAERWAPISDVATVLRQEGVIVPKIKAEDILSKAYELIDGVIAKKRDAGKVRQTVK